MPASDRPLFLRQFQHLLPNAAAWRLTINKTLRRFFDGLTGTPDDARQFVDQIYLEFFPDTTTHLADWEKQFGIPAIGNESQRRQHLAAAWQAQGGQSPSYLQTILQAAGFPVFIHEWWKPNPPFFPACCGDTHARCGEPLALCADQSFPRFVRDPHDFTARPLFGTWQCSNINDSAQAQCTDSGIDPQPECDDLLMNDPGYLVNLDLSHSPPPPIPDDPDSWHYFFYVGGANFPDRVSIPADQRPELERLILKLRPTQQWIVMLIDYV